MSNVPGVMLPIETGVAEAKSSPWSSAQAIVNGMKKMNKNNIRGTIVGPQVFLTCKFLLQINGIYLNKAACGMTLRHLFLFVFAIR